MCVCACVRLHVCVRLRALFPRPMNEPPIRTRCSTDRQNGSPPSWKQNSFAPIALRDNRRCHRRSCRCHSLLALALTLPVQRYAGLAWMALAIFVSGPRATIVVGARAHAYQQQPRREPKVRAAAVQTRLDNADWGLRSSAASGCTRLAAASQPTRGSRTAKGLRSSPPAAPAAATASLGIQTGAGAG